MYEIFERLLKERGLRAADVSRGTGLSSTFFTEWKKGKSKNPTPTNLQKIADFFGVSLDYLMTGSDSKYSDADALLDARISEDIELKEAIKKYYSLDDRKKKHILELIYFLSEE